MLVYHNVGNKQICVSLRATNAAFKDKWGYKLQSFPATVLLAPRSPSYLQYEYGSHLTAKASLCLDSSQYAIIDQIRCYLYLCDEVLILNLSLTMNNRNSYIWSKHSVWTSESF